MNYKFLFFLFPLMALTQDGFLKNLWTGKSTINNQSFTLNLHGVVYQSENRNDRYMGFDVTDFFPTKDLIFHLQEPINLNLGSTISFEEYETNFLKNFKTSEEKAPNIFPVFEYIKGKLLTVQNQIGNKSSKDFLFSISFNDKFPPRMIFNLTEELENGEAITYQIPTKIINSDVYLIFSNEILYKLGFECTFSEKKAISIQYKYNQNDNWNYCYDFGHKNYSYKKRLNDLGSYEKFNDKYNYEQREEDYNFRLLNEDYVLTIEKKKDEFSAKNWLFFHNNYHIDDEDIDLRNKGEFFFLFELVEQD